MSAPSPSVAPIPHATALVTTRSTRKPSYHGTGGTETRSRKGCEAAAASVATAQMDVVAVRFGLLERDPVVLLLGARVHHEVALGAFRLGIRAVADLAAIDVIGAALLPVALHGDALSVVPRHVPQRSAVPAIGRSAYGDHAGGRHCLPPAIVSSTARTTLPVARARRVADAA